MSQKIERKWLLQNNFSELDVPRGLLMATREIMQGYVPIQNCEGQLYVRSVIVGSVSTYSLYSEYPDSKNEDLKKKKEYSPLLQQAFNQLFSVVRGVCFCKVEYGINVENSNNSLDVSVYKDVLEGIRIVTASFRDNTEADAFVLPAYLHFHGMSVEVTNRACFDEFNLASLNKSEVKQLLRAFSF